MKTIENLGEFGLIEELLKCLDVSGPAELVGPGDDCAIIPLALFSKKEPETSLLISTDSMIQGRHFDLRYTSASQLGSKCLSTSVSDIAAMGGLPFAYLVNLQLPSQHDLDFAKEIYRGINVVAKEHQLILLGGDTTASKELALVITVIGSSDGPPVRRSGARENDDIWISGEVGASAAGLRLLLGGKLSSDLGPDEQRQVEKHLLPEARIALGLELRRGSIANSMIDVSDGMLQDLEHLCRASGLSAHINLDNLPIDEGIKPDSKSKLAALTGGEDYELLFTASSEREPLIRSLSGSSQGNYPKLTKIGQMGGVKDAGESTVFVSKSRGIEENCRQLLERELGSRIIGFQHFPIG
jgi:thiamine-monophosphate kinase